MNLGALVRVVNEMRNPPQRILDSGALLNGWTDAYRFGLWTMRVGGVVKVWFTGFIDPSASTDDSFMLIPEALRPSQWRAFPTLKNQAGLAGAIVGVSTAGDARQSGAYSKSATALYLDGLWWIAGA